MNCLQDGFVLVGSVAGQRYWSTLLPPDSTVTCGAWTPDDQQVYVATAQGGVIVMDLHGNIINKVTFTPDIPITDLQWNCEKFNMEEREEMMTFSESRPSNRMCVLAVCFNNGDIKLINSYDDVAPVVSNYSENTSSFTSKSVQLIRTGFQTMQTEWANSGTNCLGLATDVGYHVIDQESSLLWLAESQYQAVTTLTISTGSKYSQSLVKLWRLSSFRFTR